MGNGTFCYARASTHPEHIGALHAVLQSVIEVCTLGCGEGGEARHTGWCGMETALHRGAQGPSLVAAQGEAPRRAQASLVPPSCYTGGMIESVLSGTGSSSALWIDVLEPTSEELGRIAAEYGIPRASLDESTVPMHLPKHERLAGTTFVIARVYDEESSPEANAFLEMSGLVPASRVDALGG